MVDEVEASGQVWRDEVRRHMTVEQDADLTEVELYRSACEPRKVLIERSQRSRVGSTNAMCVGSDSLAHIEAANPKIGVWLGRRQRPAERQRSRVLGGGGLGGGGFRRRVRR
jgi:hypothetical protein